MGSTPDAGDPRIATLTVTPWDESTTVALRVMAPTGIVTYPTAVPTDETPAGLVWSALVPYTLPGVWTLSWTASGTGAGTEAQLVPVAPTPGMPLTGIDGFAVPPGLGRQYANSAWLTLWLRAAPPVDADQQLLAASRLVDAEIITAVYATDAEDYPTDPKIRAALSDAVCAQVEWNGANGDDLDAAVASQWSSASIAVASYTPSRTAGAAPDPGGWRRAPWMR